MSSNTLVQQISQPYAEALLNMVQSNKTVEQTNDNVSTILQILSEAKDLSQFLGNPIITHNQKKQVIIDLFKGKTSDDLITFMLFLVDRKRIIYLKDILNKYLELAYDIESIVLVDVATAIPFSEKQQRALIDKLTIMTGKTKIRLNMSVDNSLIAGFIIQVGSKVIDTSLRGQLKEISSLLGANHI
uniref:ATP synthase subunit delta, chloroplastic n=1 Tax=Yamadaella caenomyce TaxID=259029 RepID=A0A1G4NYL3_9FLOR|nr:ATP synthase CF1 subunit delta [Yamadaella caenomyce]SCW23791.1 ATP synthase CF1 subunit delta [Yamadaella caenomyce]